VRSAIESPDRHPAEPVPRAAIFLATGAGAGYGPVAPGTWGSAVGVVLYLPLSAAGPAGYAVACLGLLAAGIWAAEQAERAFGKDDGRIVIDEVVGQLLTLSPLLADPDRLRSPFWLVTGFVAFRLFDVWKPGPARWAERRFSGGLGVMLDDVVAAALAALLLVVIRQLVTR
jgi:phosphatidylglycerophosphatase A